MATVQLDHYQTIVGVHWPNLVEYVAIQTGLYQSEGLLDNTYRVSYGDVTTVGLPRTPGQDYSQYYYSHLVRTYADTYESAGGYVFNGAYDRNGELVAVGEYTVAIDGHPFLPEADTFGSDYSGGGTAHNNTSPSHYLATQGADTYPFPGSDIYKTGGLLSVFTGCAATGPVDEYNPAYPASALFTKSKPVSPTSVDVKSSNITPTSVIFNGTSYRPVAAHASGVVSFGLGNGFRGTVICRRT